MRTPAQQYEKIRQQCLTVGDLHPDATEGCFDALRHTSEGALTLAMARLLDDLMLGGVDMGIPISAGGEPAPGPKKARAPQEVGGQKVELHPPRAVYVGTGCTEREQTPGVYDCAVKVWGPGDTPTGEATRKHAEGIATLQRTQAEEFKTLLIARVEAAGRQGLLERLVEENDELRARIEKDGEVLADALKALGEALKAVRGL